MAESLIALSTAASVVSLVDVTIRACEGIYGLVASLRNAPRAVKSLRQTVEGIKTTLHNLKTFVEEYESSVTFRQHHQVLPDSVNADIVGIRENLALLDLVFTSTSEAKKFLQRAKWAVREKRILEILQRLEKQQVALLLNLQTVARRSSIARHHDMFRIETNLRQSHANSTEQVLNALKPINGHLDAIAQNEASASMRQTSRSTSVEAFRETNLELQNSLGSKIDGLVSSVSRAILLRDSIRSELILRPATNDALARIFRTELKQVVIPFVEERLNSYNSASEAQILAIRESISSMANEFHQSLQNVSRQNGSIAFQDPGPEEVESETNSREHLQDSAAARFSIREYSKTYRKTSYSTVDSDKKLWIRTWCFRWRVGTLHVTAMAFNMGRDYQTVSSAYHVCHTNEPRLAYRVLITFIPAQNFFTLRGISISSSSQRDQRGYLEMCPNVSSFAVIPEDSDVFLFSRKGNLEGLRQLFCNRAGSPTDRDENGWTPLHEAAISGNYEVCKFLLAEGADPLAIASVGSMNANCLESSVRFYVKYPERLKRIRREVNYCAVARLLHNAGCDLNDGIRVVKRSRISLCLPFPDHFRKLSEESMDVDDNISDEIITFLRCQVMDLDTFAADELARELMGCLCLGSMDSENRFGFDATYPIYLYCGLGANVRATHEFGRQPLHYLFSRTWSDEKSSQISNEACLLIRYGADVWACDDFGDTPSSLALKYGRWSDWCKILKRCGLDVESVVRTEMDRQRIREHLNDAERSGVDSEDLGFPNHEISVRRRGAYTGNVDV